jgi:methyltransferase
MVTPTRALVVTLGGVVGQRLGELMWSRRNERRLRARGAVEHGADHYRWMVVLHAGWLVATALEGRRRRAFHPLALAVFIGVQPLRLWVLRTLGDRWTTRVLTLPGAPLVATGPYRLIRHPNYAVVAVEIATLPVAFGAWRTATVASVANAAVLHRRIRIEDAALDDAARRGPSAAHAAAP